MGWLVDGFGYADAFAVFSAAGILVALVSPLYPRYIDHEPDEEAAGQEDDTGLQAAYDHQLVGEDGEPLEEAVVEGTETS